MARARPHTLLHAAAQLGKDMKTLEATQTRHSSLILVMIRFVEQLEAPCAL